MNGKTPEDPETQFWDDAYQSGEYQMDWEYAYPSQELVALVAAGVPKKRGTILDVGCGSGQEAVFLAKCGYNVIGVDISANALRIAEKLAKKANVEVDWRQGSVYKLPVPDASIDFINDRGLLHLISEERRPTYAKEVQRVLKLGGVLLIRGADSHWGKEFTPITEESITRHFHKTAFDKGPLLPIQLVSNGGVRSARIVVLKKRDDSSVKTLRSAQKNVPY
jgi:ubiquinone/menaquinone biosynthesis C-methylase UbiE